ncbi:MAG TPA: MFS transporter, partial [Saprospiraceae bacterium]|nr:MFS transporter [Saprospiraceae bacterium]
YIPYIKSNLHLNDAQLGLALFGMPLGLLIMNPFSARFIARWGLATTTTWATALLMLSFALPMWMPERWSLMAALTLNGMVVAVLNVAMNTCATNIERHEQRHIMSTCHGMWSLGGMIGSGTSALLIAAGASPRLHMTALALVISAVALGWMRPILATLPGEAPSGPLPLDAGLPDAPPATADQGRTFAWPNRDLLLMIFIGITVAMSEGVAFDWSGVYLRDELGAPAQLAALGFTCFSLAMMSLRFLGDALIPRFGERNVLYFTSFCSAMALGIIVLAQQPLWAIGGFLLLGGGVALGAPILFNAAARVPGLAAGAGLATYATFSFMGFLAGPPFIGWVGEHWSLATGFAVVMMLCMSALLAVRTVRL